jgi:hypothetical protein
VRSVVARAVKVGVALTIALGIAAFVSSGLQTILLDVYLVAIGGVFLLALVRTTRLQAPVERSSRFERALAQMRRRPPDTDELPIARDVELSLLSAFHLHVRLRPVLEMIAAHRLRTRYGVDLESEASRARELVPAATWELVRPERPPPEDRLAAGPPLSQLALVVDELERL